MLGDNIKKIRLEKGFSQKYVAEQVGVSEAYISLIESNQRQNLGSKLLEKIANALTIDVEEFFKSESLNEENLKEQDSNLDLQQKLNSTEYLDSPEEAMKFILAQPSLMAYGGYDLSKMQEEEIMDLANDMLFAMRLSIEKNKRK